MSKGSTQARDILFDCRSVTGIAKDINPPNRAIPLTSDLCFSVSACRFPISVFQFSLRGGGERGGEGGKEEGGGEEAFRSIVPLVMRGGRGGKARRQRGEGGRRRGRGGQAGATGGGREQGSEGGRTGEPARPEAARAGQREKERFSFSSKRGERL